MGAGWFRRPFFFAGGLLEIEKRVRLVLAQGWQ
jgi:hypothetical protein